ncbi:MAG: hypothetical protein ACRC68_16340 [Clostridium sp.]
MSTLFNNEMVLCSIKCSKNIHNASVIGNFFTNLVGLGVAGSVTNDFKLTLTVDNLYIESIGHAPWGGLTEVLNTEKINKDNIKSFKVENKDSEEIIELVKSDGKSIIFTRDNEKKNNLASDMEKFIYGNE